VVKIIAECRIPNDTHTLFFNGSIPGTAQSCLKSGHDGHSRKTKVLRIGSMGHVEDKGKTIIVPRRYRVIVAIGSSNARRFAEFKSNVQQKKQ
jgi:hypothetical protein